MTYFVKSGNTFKPADEKSLDIHTTLPVGNYTIKMDPFENFYFEEIDSFKLAGKIYGDTLKNVSRIMTSFHDRPATTGVLLTGEKGSGKTLLAKALSVECAKEGIPTIVINTSWHGEKFNTLMQGIEQPCMVLFDEFEKVYDSDEQQAVLTLLDGVFPSKKLFVLTCNDKWRVDQHMRNRPGRIFYLLDFRGLDVEFITEYCKENLDNQDQIPNICRVSTMFSEFNFDMLKALVEEMNRFDETAQEAIKLLNAKPQTDDGGRYNVKLRVNGFEFPEDNIEPSEWRGNPLSRESFSISQYGLDSDAPVAVAAGKLGRVAGGVAIPSDANADADHEFSYKDLKKIDPVAGSFTYTNDKGATVVFTKVKLPDFSYAF